MSELKPGKLAVIVGASVHAGRIVELIRLAPVGVKFDLPDGYPSSPVPANQWIIKAVGSKFDAPIDTGVIRKARYACGCATKLKPIDPPAEGETLEAYKNLKEPA